MLALTKFFFRAPYPSPTVWNVIGWWESRRPAYNLAVLGAGLLSLSVVALADVLPPYAKNPGIPWGGVLAYAVLANLFFSAGPVVDALITRRWGQNYYAVGPTLFRYGFAFAVGLTLLPVPLAILGWVFRLVRG